MISSRTGGGADGAITTVDCASALVALRPSTVARTISDVRMDRLLRYPLSARLIVVARFGSRLGRGRCNHCGGIMAGIGSAFCCFPTERRNSPIVFVSIENALLHPPSRLFGVRIVNSISDSRTFERLSNLRNIGNFGANRA